MGPWTLFLVLLLSIFEQFHFEATEEKLDIWDPSFCRGGLGVKYPELEVSECLIVPKLLRKKISMVWQAPRIIFSAAHEKRKYVLVMVDPDASANSASAYWLHWLVADIQGASFGKGQIEGTTLTDYRPPTPPRDAGLHRYQFMLFEQPQDANVILTEKEKESRGNWDLDAFLKRVGLGAPVATFQFLTQNYND